jgi:hypothetical protein
VKKWQFLAVSGLIGASPALADTPPAFGGPVAMGDGFSFDPIVDARLRWEDVDQPAKGLTADAVTMRLRAGGELRNEPSHLSVLVEGEGNLALDGDYNAFPYARVGSDQYRPTRAVVADPQNMGLNRAQVQYKDQNVTVTVGRQVINLDDQRWVGASAWRQNETTFDAARGTVTWGPLGVDATYSDSQRSIYGTDGGPRVSYNGHFGFLGAWVGKPVLMVKGFAYLLDYDPTAFINLPKTHGQLDSSQTYGLRATSTLPLGQGVSLALAGSYARQSSYRDNPEHYAADYWAGEGDLSAYGLTATVGYEDLGADAGAVGGPWSVQTPMATLHSFNGWADVFLTTPARGLKDRYGGLAYAFPKSLGLKGLNAKVVYHQFDSDIGAIDYGHEWDASAGVQTGRVNWLVKFADYQAVGTAAQGAGTTTRKFWLQSEIAF